MPDIKTKLAGKLVIGEQQERCGFVTKWGRVIEVDNVSPSPTTQFKISPTDIIHWSKKGAVATWHTHPNSDPNLSGEDSACFHAWDDMVHYVIGVRDGLTLVLKYAFDDGVLVQS